VSLWAIIRECVGKDLTRVCLPVYFNEPLSALQKLAEDLEYCGLLDQARCSLVLVQHTFFLRCCALHSAAEGGKITEVERHRCWLVSLDQTYLCTF